MFARSIVVDFAVVSKFSQSRYDMFQLEQSREIVRAWFWQILETSHKGYDRSIVDRDRQQEESSL
ncbi:hypothetical protein LCGC14_2078650 [marine sediment metagenome]|uniref:Uncharacterized protein n=1 Tax=marine sediment metagenome TaxID=412755 RepID=A0A0F9HD62_9ZZZZ